MKLTELFDKEEHDGDVTSSTFGYHVTKKIGERLLQFEAARSGTTWEVSFGEKMKNGGIKYDGSDTGDEIKVFSFIVASMRTFIKKYDPKRIQFSVRKIEGSKKSLYSKLVDRFAKDAFIAREFEIGLGSAEKYIQFDLIKKPTNEGMMKRSDPYISGEKERKPGMAPRDAPTPVARVSAPKKEYSAKLLGLARNTGKPIEDVSAA